MSQLVARQTKRYHFFEGKNNIASEKPKSLSIDIGELQSLALNLLEGRKLVKKYFDGYKHFNQFYYEDTFNDEGSLTEQTKNRLEKILGTRIRNVNSRFKKSPPYDSSWIKNFSKIEPYLLRGSPE